MMLFSQWLRRATRSPRLRHRAQQTRRSWIARGVERLENRRVFAGLAPSDISLSNSSIDENLAPGATVGEFSTSDSDSPGGYVYSFDGGADNLDNEHFFLTGNVIKSRESFDFESVSSYQVSIRSRDAEGNSFSKVFTINVNNLAEGAHANDDQFATEINATLNGNVLDNDSVDTGGTLTASLGDLPANGTVEFNPDGSFTYTPNAEFSGIDTFTYSIDDGQGGVDTATVSIAVGPINELPNGGDDIYSIDEDSPLVGNVLENDTDPDGDVLTTSLVDAPAHGTVQLNSDGTFTYTPNANFNGNDSFSYTLSDGFGGTDSGTVTITVNPINDLPIAGDDAITTAEDAPVSNNVLINDNDVDGDSFSTTLLDAPANGTVLLNTDGSYTYTPNADFHGSDSFTYTLNDGNGGTATGTVSVTVTPVNDAPVAGEDTVTGDEDSALMGNVLENDTDIDGDALTAALGDAPANGTVELNPDGSFTYTPNADFNGSDSFTYTLDDGQGGTATGVVNIVVNPVNDAPVAVEDAFTTDEDVVVNGNVLENDTDVDGDTLTAALGDAPASGTVELNPDGSFTYTPNADFNGSDSFTYTVDDGQGGTATGVVNIVVNAVNDAPVAVEDAFTTEEDTLLNGNVLENDIDVDGDTLTVSMGDAPANGTVELNPDGSFTYTPSADFHGSDSFTYTVDDGQGGTATGVVNIVVNAVNDVPVAVEDAFTTEEDTLANGNVLENDTDVDGDTLIVSLGDAPANGTVEVNPDGSFTYTPSADFHGSDSFTYTVDDGQGGTATGVVNIVVNPVNDAPVAADDELLVDEDMPGTGNVLANDTDIDGDAITATLGDAPAHGTVELNSDGSFTYTPSAGFHGSDSFTYTVDDGNGGTATGVVNITVNPVNDTPVAVEDAFTTDEELAVNGNVLVNDTDVDGDVLTAALQDLPANGMVEMNSDGSFTYTPNADFYGVDTFTYVVDDGQGGTATGTVTITVNPVNDAPVAVEDAVETDEDTWLSGNVLENDTDIDGDALTATLGDAPANGTVEFNPDGSFTYTPNADFNGSDSFTYSIDDGQGGVATGVVNITVHPMNDVPIAGEDLVVTDEDVPATGNVLVNDTDIDGDALTAALQSLPSNGMVELNSDGSFTYTPSANFHGTDSFTYTVDDGNGGTAVGVVNITVNDVNDNPSAGDDAVTTDEDVAAVIPIASLLANDADSEGESPVFLAAGGAVNGTVIRNGDNLVFTPNANFNGTGSFVYAVSDGNGGFAFATVTVTVNGMADPPTAVDDAVSTEAGVALTIPASDLTANDTDPEGDALTVVAVGGGSGGTVALSEGNVTFTPAEGFSGTGSFHYVVSDGTGFALGHVSVEVTGGAVNTAPVAADDLFNLDSENAGDPVMIAVADLLANDVDAEGDALILTGVGNPIGGTVELSGDQVIFTPSAGAEMSASLVIPQVTFTYTISDGNGGEDTGTVTLNIEVADGTEGEMASLGQMMRNKARVKS